jgi:uncharacterized protein YbjT (DUF2867 family)
MARAASVVLKDPAPHIGKIYNLIGFESADLEHYARVFSEALGRTIRYPTCHSTAGAKGFKRRACRHTLSSTSPQ